MGSSFYYQRKQSFLDDKYAAVKQRIRTIYYKHHVHYGYRRVNAAMENFFAVLNTEFST